MKKKTGKAGKWRQLVTAVNMELKEHRSSFLVFWILRALVLVTLVRQAFLGNYESVFFCALTMLLLYLPSLIQVQLRIELPTTLEIIILCFIFAAEILGELGSFYVRVPYWDTMLHTVNGFLAAAIGFSLAVLLNKNERIVFDLSPLFLAIVAFCFSMTIGVVWEFFECFMDLTFHTDMQKDTIVHAVYSVALDPTRTNTVVGVTGITDTAVNGQSLGLGGYLDIGLLDTMKDLFVNFIGAAVFSVIGFLFVKHRGKGRVAKRFIPSRKEADRDYLKAAREAEQDGRQGDEGASAGT